MLNFFKFNSDDRRVSHLHTQVIEYTVISKNYDVTLVVMRKAEDLISKLRFVFGALVMGTDLIPNSLFC